MRRGLWATQVGRQFSTELHMNALPPQLLLTSSAAPLIFQMVWSTVPILATSHVSSFPILFSNLPAQMQIYTKRPAIGSRSVRALIAGTMGTFWDLPSSLSRQPTPSSGMTRTSMESSPTPTFPCTYSTRALHGLVYGWLSFLPLPEIF